MLSTGPISPRRIAGTDAAPPVDVVRELSRLEELHRRVDTACHNKLANVAECLLFADTLLEISQGVSDPAIVLRIDAAIAATRHPVALLSGDADLSQLDQTEAFKRLANEKTHSTVDCTPSEMQGTTELRRKARLSGIIQPSKFSHQGLEGLRLSQPALYYTLFVKRIGHVFSLHETCSLKGTCDIFGKKTYFEGFSEDFVLPMLAASLEVHAVNQTDSKDQDRFRWLSKRVSHTLSPANITPALAEAAALRIQTGNVLIPITLTSGYNWHVTTIIFWQDMLIYINRGRDSKTGAEISIYTVPETSRSLITSDMIQKLVSRHEIDHDNYMSQQQIERTLGLANRKTNRRGSQKSGNCSYANCRTMVDVLNAIYDCITCDSSGITLEQALDKAKPMFKQWTAYERRTALEWTTTELQAATQLSAGQYPRAALLLLGEQVTSYVNSHSLRYFDDAARSQLKTAHAALQNGGTV